MKCKDCVDYRYEIKELKKDMERLEESLWRYRYLKECGHCEKYIGGHYPECRWFIKPLPSSRQELPQEELQRRVWSAPILEGTLGQNQESWSQT